MKYDVAIVGGGPAGAWLSRDLARKGVSVVLLERSKVIGEPNFSSAGSLKEAVSRYDIPVESVASEWDIGETVFSTHPVTWRFSEPVGVVFDFRKLKTLLLQEAIAAGADVILGQEAREIAFADDAGGATIRTKEGLEYEAKIVVDASGPESIFASQLGLRREHAKPAVGLEIICEVPSFPEDQPRTFVFYTGVEWAPYGYAWIFAMGGNRFKVGLCTYELANHPEVDLAEQLDKFINKFDWLKDRRTIETHGGSAYAKGGIKDHSYRNLLAIGDAADQINPLGGEGVRHAFQSAEFASTVIRKCLQGAGVSSLREYNQLWRKYIGSRWYLSKVFAYILFEKLKSRGLSWLSRNMNKLTPHEVIDLMFRYKFSILFKAALFRRSRPS